MTLHISGIMSGLDTESIIEAMMASRQQSIDSLQEKVETESEKYSAWSELDTKLSDLHSVTSQLVNYTTWRQMSATVTDPTTGESSSVLTASADATAQAGTYTVAVSALAYAHRIGSDDIQSTLGKTKTDALGLTGDFTINGQTVSVDTADTLEDIRDKINTASQSMSDDDKVTASIIGNTLVIERNNTGSTEISISETTGNDVLRTIGVLTSTENPPGTYQEIKNELQAASDLSATINGVSITSSSNTVDDEITGLTLNIQTTGTAKVTVDHDIDTIRSLIDDFIEKYNDAMSLAKTQGEVVLGTTSTGETGVASTGVLQGDYLIADIQVKMRTLVTTEEDNPNYLDPDYNSLYTIGIWTESLDNEISIIDEDKLTDALTNHFDEVEDLFRDYNAGIIRQIDDYVYDLISPIDGRVTAREDDLRDEVNDLNNQIDEMTLDLQDYEAELWEHFASMENMVGSIKSQWQYMASSLGLS